MVWQYRCMWDWVMNRWRFENMRARMRCPIGLFPVYRQTSLHAWLICRARVLQYCQYQMRARSYVDPAHLRELPVPHNNFNGGNVSPLSSLLHLNDCISLYAASSLEGLPAFRICWPSQESFKYTHVPLRLSQLPRCGVCICCIIFMTYSSRGLASDSELVFWWGRTSPGKKITYVEGQRLHARRTCTGILPIYGYPPMLFRKSLQRL